MEGLTIESYKSMSESERKKVKKECLSLLILNSDHSKLSEEIIKLRDSMSALTKIVESMKAPAIVDDRYEILSDMKKNCEFLREELQNKNELIKTLMEKPVEHEVTNISSQNQAHNLLEQNLNISLTIPEGNKTVTSARSVTEQLEVIRKSQHDSYLKSIQVNDETKRNQTNISYNDNDKEYNKEKQWPKGTICILGDSMISGVREKLLSKQKVVKVRSYPGATIEDMRHNAIPILKRKPSTIILHVGTNDTNNCTSREIIDKLLSLKKFITDRIKDCKVIISEIITRLDDGITTLKVSKFNILLS